MAKKLYEESNIANIAKMLRLKNDESEETFTTSQMSDGVLAFPYSNIPKYHYAEISRVLTNIMAFKSAHPNHLMFGAISDNHVYANDETYEKLTKQSIRHAAFALETIGMIADADFIANLGDNCWENGIDTENAYEGSIYVKDAIQSGFSKITSYRLIGNHDKTDYTEKSYQLNGAYNSFDKYGTEQIRGFGYKDFESKKVRVICLNTADYLHASGGHGMSYDQKDFLLKALDLSSKEDVSSWNILVLSHFPIDFNGGDYNIYADLKTIFDAYVNGSTASITVNNLYALNENPLTYDTYSNGSLVYDYAGKNLAKIIANIHGHVHTNAYGYISDNGILRMATPNACYYLNKIESYPDYGDYSISEEEGAKLIKSENSAKDTSVTFYCVDLDNHVIYAYGYGANTDRVASYNNAKVYSVTYDLTNITSSNTVSFEIENQPFTTKLTLADNAELKSITVTMNGVDITSTAYNNGVITIDQVSGDIVIQATAEIKLPYTNLFVESDVQIGKRFNSSGEIIDGVYWCMSTYIPCVSGDVIRIYCPGVNWNDHAQRIICAYDSEKNHIANDVYASQLDEISADGYLATATVSDGTTYVRISGLISDEYSQTVITLNEEIPY